MTDQENCKHDWVYSDFVLTSNPPQYPKICRKCGKRENEWGKMVVMSDYDQLVEKFGGKK